MIDRIGPVEGASSVSTTSATVRRTDQIAEVETGGIAVQATDHDLLETLGATLAAGRFIDDAIDGYPAVVLGAVAAERLGITSLEHPVLVWIGDRWWSVVGILDPLPLAPEIDRSALVGRDVAEALLGADMPPRRRSTSGRRRPSSTTSGRCSRRPPTRRIPRRSTSAGRRTRSRRKAAAATAFTALFLGLGAVALLVGGLGIANVMLMAVLERRNEIGLRRALGATRGHIVGQFLAEAVLLAGFGGVIGAVLGAAIAAAYASSQGWLVALPVAGLVRGRRGGRRGRRPGRDLPGVPGGEHAADRSASVLGLRR